MPLFRDLVRLLPVVSVSVFAVACASAPPPEEPEPAPPPVEEPKPEPPPKPECKSLDEKCKADESTQAKVAHSDLVFIPPPGWVYAQEPEVTIAQTEEGGGGLVVTSIPGSDNKSKEFKEKRDAAVETLAQALGVTLPNKPGTKKRATPNWDRPDGDTKAGEVKLEIWQFDGASRGSKDGPVVFILGRNGDSSLLAIGFAPKGDSSDQAIMKALETIGPGSPQ